MTRQICAVALLLVLPGCAVAALTDSVNQLGMTPGPDTFMALDCDHNGTLAQAETGARLFVRTKALTSLHNLTAEEFRAGDGNADGKWSQAEFTAALVGTTAWSVSPGGCGG